MSDLIQPCVMRLMQRAKDALPGSKAGEFYDTTTLTPIGKRLRECSILKIVRSRGFHLSKRFTCTSVDGIRPDESGTWKASETCARCEHAKWSLYSHSRCSDNWHVLLALNDSPVPYWLTAGKGATRLIRALERRAQLADYIAKQIDSHDSRSLCDFCFDLVPVRGKQGRYGYWTMGETGWKYIESTARRKQLTELVSMYRDALPVLSNASESEAEEMSEPTVDERELVSL